MKIAVLGIGGVGGLVGGALARVNKDTCFCVRGENLRAIEREGLKVESKLLGSFVARPAIASDDAAKIGRCDAVIVACKGNALAGACETITPMVGEHTLVVPLLNGLLVSQAMEKLLPKCVLADGLIHVFSHLEGPGHVWQQGGSCGIKLGMRDGPNPPALIELTRLLCDAGLPAALSDNIALDSWRKFSLMCGNSVIVGLYGGPAGVVNASPDHREVCRAVWGEQVAVAAACGVALQGDLPDTYLAEFEGYAPDTITSLYRDLQSGKAPENTELEHVVGRLVRLGREKGVATPLHEKMFLKYGGVL